MKNSLLAAVVALAACAPKEEKRSLSDQLIGEWRNVYMQVDMPTYRNTDSASILKVTEETWEQVLKIRTIQTFYRADGTYNSVHTDLQDSVIYNPAGKWAVEGDSIIMTDTFPQKGMRYAYKIAIKENELVTVRADKRTETIAEFSGMEDFDQDGKKDDAYYGKQRKQ